MLETELYHHGIEGQKWGKRNGPPYPLNRTASGMISLDQKKLAKKYQNGLNDNTKNKSSYYFNRAKKRVVNKASNSYSKFIKKPINIQNIKSRGNVNSKDAKICASLAMKIYNKSSIVEPKITNDIVSLVSDLDCKMYGLEKRLKQPTSIAGKIASDAKEKKLSYKEASKRINDSIRYTILSDENNFVKNYKDVKSKLVDKGYDEIKCKNYFVSFKRGESMHKSVQSVFKNKNGIAFEIQFQTPSSQAAKELKVPLYEERRKIGITDSRAKELEFDMKRLGDMVEYPLDINLILAHSCILLRR